MAGPPKTLHSRAVAEKTGIVLTAPPQKQNASPKIPAEVALATAWEEEGSEGEAKSTQLTYALLTSGIYAKTPVWLVTYYGTCVPAPGNEQRCAKINFHTLINADTDKFIGSFVDRSLHI